MKILLSDASSLTSRQVATILHAKGHEVHALNSSGSFLVLANLTNCVRKVHPVPAFGRDPYRWLDAVVEVIENEKVAELSGDKRWEWNLWGGEGRRGRMGKGFDVLICTQEQVAILSAEQEKVKRTGVRFAVPSFEALRRVMGKRAQLVTLNEAGIDQPKSLLPSESGFDLEEANAFIPGYLKTDIGTASRGVRRISILSDLDLAINSLGGLRSNLLLQKEMPGNLVMVSAIFAHSQLRVWHACLRAHQGPGGGASKKVSLPLPGIEDQVRDLGRELGWHGALSADAILCEGKVWWVDINPRVCEPVNAWLAGTDMVGALLDLSREERDERVGSEIIEHKSAKKRSMEGVETHQLILSFMGAAERGRGWLVVEVMKAVMGFERYAGSREELTVFEGDWFWSLLLLGVLVVVLFVGGKRAVDLGKGGAVGGYALEEKGWEMILKREEAKERGVGEVLVVESGNAT